MKFDDATNEVVVCEEFIEDIALAEARREREQPLLRNDNLKPLATIPQSEMNRAIREGWANDQDQWARWARDIDNRNLQSR